MRRVTDRHMKLIRGDYIQAGIAIFPPILMSGDNHFEGATRPRRILNRRNHTRGRQKQGQHNEYRDHGPGKFNLRAPVDLSRLSQIIVALVPEPDGDVSEQSEHDDEYRSYVYQNEYRKSEDRIGGSGGWGKNTRGTHWDAATLHSLCPKWDGCE